MTAEFLRRGDLVEIRSPAEILATLDGRGALEGLPFMPEMVAYCGRRFQVDRRADKICDTIQYTGSRRVPDTVLLADLRCDGSSHGGCQAECRLFWKQAWLRKVPADSAPAGPPPPEDLAKLLELTQRSVKHMVERQGTLKERWSCQATSLLAASRHLRLWDPRPYIEQYTHGNVELGHCLRITARAAIEEPLRKLGVTPKGVVKGTATGTVTEPSLGLQPGELVRVRSTEEIARTLTPDGYNRGLWFDREMAAYCGGTFRVLRRIQRFIDEFRDTGRMVELKSDAVTLEGVVCTGDLSHRRWFCPRNIYPYWRECWLERVAAAPPPGAAPA